MKSSRGLHAALLGLGAVLLTLVVSPTGSAPLGLREIQPRTPAPELGLVDLSGRTHELDDYRGQVLVVSFWATWCSPCIKELPALTRTADELLPSGVRVITVAMGQSADEVREFVAEQNFPMAKLVDPDADAAERWRVQALPTAYVVDPQGRLALRIVGNYDWDDAEFREKAVALFAEGRAKRP